MFLDREPDNDRNERKVGCCSIEATAADADQVEHKCNGMKRDVKTHSYPLVQKSLPI